MPARSAKQYGLMQAALHGNLKKEGGPSKAVAQDFVQATPPDKRKKFAQALSNRKTKSL
jgi:hypothetical protein